MLVGGDNSVSGEKISGVSAKNIDNPVPTVLFLTELALFFVQTTLSPPPTSLELPPLHLFFAADMCYIRHSIQLRTHPMPTDENRRLDRETLRNSTKYLDFNNELLNIDTYLADDGANATRLTPTRHSGSLSP